MFEASSSGYSQSSSPLRMSSLPPVVSSFTSPLATLTTYRFDSRTKLIHFPSGENLGSSSHDATSVFANDFGAIVFKSKYTRFVQPVNRSAPPTGDQMYLSASTRPRPVA